MFLGGIERDQWLEMSSSYFFPNQNKLINFYPSWNHKKTKSFLIISEGIEGSQFAQIRVIIEAKFRDEPLVCAICYQHVFGPMKSQVSFCRLAAQSVIMFSLKQLLRFFWNCT